MECLLTKSILQDHQATISGAPSSSKKISSVLEIVGKSLRSYWDTISKHGRSAL